jgi:GH18 family chitinase
LWETPRHVRSHTDAATARLGLDHVLSQGVPASKLALGLATYGRGYQLVDPAQAQLGSAHTGVAAPARTQTGEAGVLTYRELRQLNPPVEAHAGASHARVQDAWVGFDAPRDIRHKLTWVRELPLAGVAVWSIDLDDGLIQTSLAAPSATSAWFE